MPDDTAGTHGPERITIQINRVHYEVNVTHMTGEQPPAPEAADRADRDLFEVVPGHPDRKIETARKSTCATGPGSSPRLLASTPAGKPTAMTVPLLLPADCLCLEDRGLAYEVTAEAGRPASSSGPGTCRRGMTTRTTYSSGCHRLPRCRPGHVVVRAGGQAGRRREVQAAEVAENHLGRAWQRWSRHFQPGQWRSGVDGLESYLALIRRELIRCAGSGPA